MSRTREAPRTVMRPAEPRPSDRPAKRLPVHLSRFIGREAELAAIRPLLQRDRLVTLTGVGGAGKTRLAARVAAEQADRWPDGACWIELAPVTDPAEVAEAAASSVGAIVERVGGPLRSLAVHLKDRKMLVCLDNCEHVLDGAAGLADALLRSCPGISMLTTSREPLGVPGEVTWPVPPLGADDAFALFVDRARRIQPRFTLDASSESSIRSLCTRLDGIPLALELAAAWLRTLTPHQIEAGLDDRFSLLVRAPRGAEPRQQSLAASIDWSYTLLYDSDRMVFRRLAVFADSFDLDAARTVCAAGTVDRADVLGCIGRLVDQSLVVAEEQGGEARYRLLETIREYAVGRLDEAGESTAARDRHLDHFVAFVDSIDADREENIDAWRTRLEAAYDDLRVALEWGLAAPDPERGRRLTAALPWLWHLHGHGPEGIEYLSRAIGRAPDDRSRLQARLLTGIAIVADTARPLDLEFNAAQRALEIATELDDGGLRALCLILSAVGQFYTDFDTARLISFEALAAAEAAGDALVADGARALQGIILHLRDRHEEAEPLLQSAVEGLLWRHRGIAATTLGYQARGALFTGDIERARRLAEKAVEIAEPLADYHRVGSTRSVLALVHALAGDIDGGFAVIRPVLLLVEGADHQVFVPGMASAMGALHLRRGEPETAATWFEREARSTDRGTQTWLAAEALPRLGRCTCIARTARRGTRCARSGGCCGRSVWHAARCRRGARAASAPRRP
jgi:predicted ATPase